MENNEPIEQGHWRDPSQISVRRSFVLLGGGALIGLILAGYALFTARGTSTLIVPADAVALVNQQPISRVDYLIALQSLYTVDLQHSTAAQRKRVLDDMIREELFVQRGKELDLASIDPEVRNALVSAVEAEISRDAVTSVPSEADLRHFYAVHEDTYSSEGTMSARDIVLPTTEAAKVPLLLDALKSQGPTPEALKSTGARDSRIIGDEEFYFAAKVHLGERLFDAARGLQDGGVSSPITLPNGIHIISMLKNRPPVPLPFDAARAQVLNDFQNDAVERNKKADESFLVKRANILIADDLR